MQLGLTIPFFSLRQLGRTICCLSLRQLGLTIPCFALAQFGRTISVAPFTWLLSLSIAGAAEANPETVNSITALTEGFFGFIRLLPLRC